MWWWLAAALASGAVLPRLTFPPELRHASISGDMGAAKHNQPLVIDGYLVLAGNARFEVWDIADPYRPELLATFASPHGDGEAESHTHAVLRRPDGRQYLATVSGLGVDLWEVTDPLAWTLASSVLLEGVRYGDNTEAVWGVAWQGDALYVGGTSSGLHVVDTEDPTSPRVVTRLPTTSLGGVIAGPVWAMGDTLVITTPKDFAGVATVDVSEPFAPHLLDAELPGEDSYMGLFYGAHAWLLTPLRAYDVLSDPSDLRLVSSTPTPRSEYGSFSDGTLLLGALRPDNGVYEVDVRDPRRPVVGVKIDGRRQDGVRATLSDDQFSLAIGNLLVLSDDEIGMGSHLVVRDPRPDSAPPAVLAVAPADGATGVLPSSRVTLSFSDALDLRTVDAESVILRSLGGAPVLTQVGQQATLLHLWPEQPLRLDTTYEVIVPSGGVTDLGGVPIATAFRATFSTGAVVQDLPCAVEVPGVVEVGATLTLTAPPSDDDLRWAWSLDGAPERFTDTPALRVAWDTPGRKSVRLRVLGAERSVSCGAEVVVWRPPAGAPTRAGGAVVALGDDAVLVDAAAGAVVRLDPVEGVAVWSTTLEGGPQQAVVVGDGTVWVSLRDDDALVVLDAEDGAVIERVPLDYGDAPVALGVDPDGGRVWVALRGAGEIASVSAVTRAVTLRWSAGVDAAGVPATPGGLGVAADRVVASRALAGASGGWFELTPDGQRGTRRVLEDDEGPDTHDGGRGRLTMLHALAVSPDGAVVALAGSKANVARGLFRDGQPLTPDQTMRAVVVLLDGDEERRIDLDDHAMPEALAFSPRGDLLFVASEGSHVVDVIEVATGRLRGGVTTGLGPDGLVVTDGGLLVVQDGLDHSASIYDVADLLDGRDGAARRLGTVELVDVSALDPVLERGRRLFHDARSPRMSQDGYLACASCHPDGGHDGVTWDFTDRGEGLRNTIDLRGKAGGHGRLHWTGNFDELQDFEGDIRNHQGGSGLLDDAAWAATADPLGAPKAGLSEDLDALAAYVASFDRFPRSPHRAPDGAYTDAALRGWRQLERVGCLSCHAGDDLIDGERHDVGTWYGSSGGRLGQPNMAFDTPTLHGLHASAPYLHDGRAGTLREAMDVFGHGQAFRLTARQQDDVVAALLQLDCAPPEREGCACDAAAGPRWGPALVALAASLRRRRGRPPGSLRRG